MPRIGLRERAGDESRDTYITVLMLSDHKMGAFLLPLAGHIRLFAASPRTEIELGVEAAYRRTEPAVVVSSVESILQNATPRCCR